MTKTAIIGCVLAAILTLAGVAFFALHKNSGSAATTTTAKAIVQFNNPPPEHLPIITSTPVAPSLLPPRMPPAGYAEYRSEFYRFQFFYPSNLAVTEYRGADSSDTITFKDSSTGEQFQLFILPYGDAQISEQRFKLDIPSGVIASSTTFTVDNASASSFYSTDKTLGKTHEVWFLGRGFLYEATTYQALDTWMDGMLQSWQFL
jgi:hypothetical protein